MKKAIIAFSDTHIGSHSGLCSPKGIQLDNGGMQMPSVLQEYTWNCWQHFWDEYVPAVTKKIPAKHITVVANGDVIDGNHHQAVDLVPNVWTRGSARR